MFGLRNVHKHTFRLVIKTKSDEEDTFTPHHYTYSFMAATYGSLPTLLAPVVATKTLRCCFVDRCTGARYFTMTATCERTVSSKAPNARLWSVAWRTAALYEVDLSFAALSSLALYNRGQATNDQIEEENFVKFSLSFDEFFVEQRLFIYLFIYPINGPESSR